MVRLTALALRICQQTGLLVALICAIVAQYWSLEMSCPLGHLHLEAPGWVLQMGVRRPLRWTVDARDTDIEQCILNPFFERRQFRVLNVPSGVAHELRQSTLSTSRMIGIRHHTLLFLLTAANAIWLMKCLRSQRKLKV
ncbi:MAG: hypothetical protein NXI04_08010 [Planctomycetaceae bacterium]|nr:hypothetical protein [Planctomycetaceae bacterium]